MSLQQADWRVALDEPGPRYLQIVRFMENAIADGRLRAGDRLPPQRELARALGVDLTTVTRAYAEARERNLLHARGAMGSFVSAPRFDTVQRLDLDMNLPPPPLGVDLGDLLRRGFEQVLTHSETHALMSYHPGGGTPADRRAGAAWLAGPLGKVDPERVVISPGAQVALSALLLTLTAPGESIACEPLIYPGFLSAAGQLGRHILPLAADAEGMLPEALGQAAQQGVRVAYLNPTLRNPIATTMGTTRRDALASVATRHGLVFVEDDPYWPLATQAPAPLAARVAGHTYYVATLSKSLTPGLRTAYVVVPDGEARASFLHSLSALALMSTPVMTSLATQWIQDGTAAHIVDGVRAEADERRRMAVNTLRLDPFTRGEGIHLWVPLPPHWTAQALASAARAEGLAVTPSQAFSATTPTTEAIRISLGGMRERSQLKHGLERLAWLLNEPANHDDPNL
ncbi:PLP-dependent aminotransferase family protein [Luteibacter aegosomatissinici]|uniref:aminotransferase-like domain-containing protein n=1 Tax=Luteibacter aegosomatissinici TaxID=2911539 RepID=UPI001FF98D8B|nr:PLP-dependent aminotransferase family protein [Luteibacter aegosomatissinici]UPG94348.1 PLP-dependent aminotransferase family protein [Luteibacter aegosomatissinici]